MHRRLPRHHIVGASNRRPRVADRSLSAHGKTWAERQRTSLNDSDSGKFDPWALITGASSGIGREFAKQIAASGINTVLVARRQNLLEEAGHEIVQEFGVQYRAIVADLSESSSLQILAQATEYLIPGVQLGSKIRPGSDGSLLEVMSANRPVRPGRGYLWCDQLIDPEQLAKEAKSDEERKAQAYGVDEPNPSVISLNGISSAHAVNDFMLDYLNLRPAHEDHYYEHFHCLKGKQSLVIPRSDADCPECSPTGLRFGRADSVSLPCIEG
jgi:short chain dehydrogenase